MRSLYAQAEKHSHKIIKSQVSAPPTRGILLPNAFSKGGASQRIIRRNEKGELYNSPHLFTTLTL